MVLVKKVRPLRKQKLMATSSTPLARPFTPLGTDGIRLRLDADTIEVLEGSIRAIGPGKTAVIRFDGRTYHVIGTACGLSCFCDARLEEVL